METHYIAGILITIVLIVAVVSIIFGLGQRVNSNSDPTDDLTQYGDMFAQQAEICEKYDGTEISEADFRIILAVIRKTDCRELDVSLGFSMTKEKFGQMIEDIFPKNQAPEIIYKDGCNPMSVETGSFIVREGSGEYLYRKGDNIKISIFGESLRDVIICLII
ncbi:MAG: hypothetical protein JW716_05025 [Candidatus Aenigmarchaeota archaeon]|nr:hypothetical protein [Candidatus Aenigmarchaeota archaeon]